MNCLWILVLLFCCGKNNTGCNERNCNERRCARNYEHPRAPFAPECDRERDRDRDYNCGCRASEMEHSDFEECAE